jgi:hypothetical protein
MHSIKRFSSSLILLFTVLLLCCAGQNTLNAQQRKVYHFLYGHYARGLNKVTYLGGYSVGYKRAMYNISYGTANGTDNQFLPADQQDNNILKGELSSSAVVEPQNKPANSYLEAVDSKYEGYQWRAGLTVFLRRNDTLDRKAFSGPHAGLEGSYMRVTENQTVTYKSETSEQRWLYSGTNQFHAVGAVSHIGWQFALLHERLYLDTRFVVPFLYPFTEDPNINSPFAGTKYEFQVSAAWHIGWGKHDKNPKDTDAPKVREKI